MQINHNALKEYAHKLLKNMGFEDSEIHEEYHIKTNEMKDGFRVDVVGIKRDKRVAVECGLTNSDKLIWEKLFFDEVIVLPFFKMDTENALLHRRIRELETQNTKKSNELEEVKKFHQELINRMGDHELFYSVVCCLIKYMEGKSRVTLAGYDSRLNNALDSLFANLINYRDAFDYQKKELEQNARI